MRVLVILQAVWPEPLDLSDLAFHDYGLLHTAELGGPGSIHPQLPAAPGELGIKQSLVEDGLQVMIRAGMVEPQMDSEGIRYRATEEAAGFIGVLRSEYLKQLEERATWVARFFASSKDRAKISTIYRAWRSDLAGGR
jgi:hypothetical protein